MCPCLFFCCCLFCATVDGPSTVTVTGPTSPVDTNGQTLTTLTCQPSISTPSVPWYTWRRLPGSSVVGSEKTLNFTASRDGDGVTYECTATNSQFSDLSASDTYTLSLNCKSVLSHIIYSVYMCHYFGAKCFNVSSFG